MRSRSEIEQAASTAAAKLLQARTDLVDARKAFQIAEEAWLEGGKKSQAERKREAADTMERAEVVEKRAGERYEAEAAKLAKLEREDRVRELESARQELSTVDDSVDVAIAEFVALDRALDDKILEVAAVIVAAAAKHDHALALAAELRLPHRLDARPSLAEACLRVRRALTAVRAAEDRDDLSLWITTSPDAGDWRMRDMSAADLASNQRAAAFARATEAHNAATASAVVAINALASAPAPTPTETP
ncbi:MAG TPA: hypothetical protein VGM06_01795 [Polyangiaceae bacterium]